MKTRRKLVGNLIVAVFLVLLIAMLLPYSYGCRASRAEGLKEVTVFLDWVPNTNHTGIFVAQALDYYMEEGLDVEIIQPSEGGSADLVAAGRGQFGISYQEQVTYARTSDEPLPIVAIAAVIQHNTSGFASPVDRDIHTPKDFEGKRYGGWGSPTEEAILKGLMEKYGADFDELEIVNIGAADFFISVQRDVDFAWIFYGWTGIEAELRDIELDFMLLQDVDSRLDFYTPVIITSEDIISRDPQLVKDFLTATKRGYLYSIEDPESAAGILLEASPEIDRELAVESQEYLAEHYITEREGWGFMKEEIWDTFSTWMHEKALIANKLDVDAAYTNKFIE